jgi:hypothetical protein
MTTIYLQRNPSTCRPFAGRARAGRRVALRHHRPDRHLEPRVVIKLRYPAYREEPRIGGTRSYLLDLRQRNSDRPSNQRSPIVITLKSATAPWRFRTGSMWIADDAHLDSFRHIVINSAARQQFGGMDRGCGRLR